MNLQNSVIVITGASSGIGSQLAKDLAKEGAQLALIARRIELLNSLSDQLSLHTKVISYKCDVCIKDEVAQTVEQIKKDFGKIDAVILNSGIGITTSALEYNSEAAEKTFCTNVFGAIYFIERVLPEFISEKRGTIVGLSSLGDSKGFPKSGFYSASKSALTIILESLRIELKKYNVRVVTIKPGFVKTPMTDKNNFDMPFLMSVEKASNIILNRLKKNKDIIEFPLLTALGAKFLKLLPARIFEFLASKEPKSKK